MTMANINDMCAQEFDGSSIECSRCEENEESYAAVLDAESGYLDSQTARFSTYCDNCERELEDANFALSVQQQ